MVIDTLLSDERLHIQFALDRMETIAERAYCAIGHTVTRRRSRHSGCALVIVGCRVARGAPAKRGIGE
jgi:hypothetical protein